MSAGGQAGSVRESGESRMSSGIIDSIFIFSYAALQLCYGVESICHGSAWLLRHRGA